MDMTFEEMASKKLEGLCKLISDRGYSLPRSYFAINFFGEKCSISIGYRSSTAVGAPESNQFFHGESFDDCLKEAEVFISEMKTVEDVRRKDFIVALANLMEMGREIGIEEGFINPLEVMMKKMSTNIIEGK